MRVLFAMLLLVGFAVGAAEPTQTFTDDLNRKVVVPVHPKRIVSLHDLDITIPLIELGVPPVASHGRTRPDGSHFLRSSGMLTGVDFDNSDIKFIGTADIDIEAIAAAKPDHYRADPQHAGGAAGKNSPDGEYRSSRRRRAGDLPQTGAADGHAGAAQGS